MYIVQRCLAIVLGNIVGHLCEEHLGAFQSVVSFLDTRLNSVSKINNINYFDRQINLRVQKNVLYSEADDSEDFASYLHRI